MPVVNSLFPLPSTETPSEKNVGIPAGPLKSVFLMQPPMKQTQSQIKNPQSRAAGPAPPSLGEQAVSSRTLRAARPSFPALFTKINKSFLVFFFSRPEISGDSEHSGLPQSPWEGGKMRRLFPSPEGLTSRGWANHWRLAGIAPK